jgi:hypothetical protein
MYWITSYKFREMNKVHASFQGIRCSTFRVPVRVAGRINLPLLDVVMVDGVKRKVASASLLSPFEGEKCEL